MATHGNYINGIWQPAAGGAVFPNESPAQRGRVLGQFAESTPADLDAAVGAAHAARSAWRRTATAERQARVQRFLDELAARREELARIVTEENGKTIREARGEVDSALLEGRYHCQQAAAFHGQAITAGTPDPLGWEEYEPLGVVAVISPWNFPVNVMCRKTLPALLTGNTVVFKPASFTPGSGVFMARLFEAAGFPAGVFNCVTGPGGALGDALLRDPRVQAVSFTGSTEVGLRIQAAAAQRLVRTQLELGGKNAAIVMADADLDAAVAAVMTAGFACAGQWCTSTSRVLVERGVRDAVIERLAARCAALVVGDPLDERTEMGPVAGPSQYRAILAAIERGRAEGARLVTGGAVGGALGEAGYFVRPTVFDGVRPEMSLFREEIFGPVLAVTTFDGLDEALALANDSDYGLSSALFTRDIGRARRYLREIEAGMAHVNLHTGYKHPSLPFGGWKQSGFGLPENGRTGLEFFVNRKAVYIAQG